MLWGNSELRSADCEGSWTYVLLPQKSTHALIQFDKNQERNNRLI